MLDSPIPRGISSTPVKQLIAHSLGHVDCQACNDVRARVTCSISADLSFSEAADRYLQLRSLAATPGALTARYIRKNTEKDYRSKLGSIALFFGATKLGDIHWFNMRAYQQARLAGDPPFVRKRRPHEEPSPCPAKSQQVNQEMGMLKRIKMRAGCWSDEDQAYFEYLQEEVNDVQRSLTPEEQQKWIDVCRLKPRWELVHWWTVAAIDTLTSTNELRGLRLGDVNLHHNIIRVPWAAAKNPFRRREIPLENPDALWAFDQLIRRAYDLGARSPHHYLFPFKITRSKEAFPDRHMTESGIKKLWQEVREASGLTWFRMYDTRHTGASRLAEQGVPTEIIVARMGHCNDHMRRHYTHISNQAQRRWLRKTTAQVESIGPYLQGNRWR